MDFATRNGGKTVLSIVDTGAFSIWIDQNLFQELGGTLIPEETVAMDVIGRPVEVVGRGYVDFGLWGCKIYAQNFRIMKRLPCQVLIGRQFLLLYGLQMDFEKLRGCITVRKRKYWGEVQLSSMAHEQVRAVVEDMEVDTTIQELPLIEFYPSPKMQQKLRDILWKHRQIFKGVGCIKGLKHKIRLHPDTEPVASPIRRRLSAEQQVERDTMEKLLQAGIVEHSESPWAANNVFVPKKDGSLRCTTDFRALNSRTVSDQYSMEGVKENLDWLVSKNDFSTFDLKDGYFQVELDVASRQYTAVRTVVGLLQYCRLPMGMKNSPGVFQRIVNRVLGNFKGKSVWAFMDDVNVGTEDEETHLNELNKILTC